MKHITCLCAVFLLGACGTSGTADDGHTFRIEVGEDGVPVSITSMVPKYDQPLFRLVEEVHLGQDEQHPESLLFRAYQCMQDPDGNYYVMDSGNNRVAVFDTDGTFMRAFGREGDGPGEFRYPQMEQVDKNGVVVYDSGARRLLRFSLEGRLLATYPFRGTGYSMVQMILGPDRIGLMSVESERKPDRSARQAISITMVDPTSV